MVNTGLVLQHNSANLTIIILPLIQLLSPFPQPIISVNCSSAPCFRVSGMLFLMSPRICFRLSGLARRGVTGRENHTHFDKPRQMAATAHASEEGRERCGDRRKTFFF